MLNRGFDPMRPDTKDMLTDSLNMNFMQAMDYAYNNKKGDWSEKTKSDYKYRHDKFIEWMKYNNVAGLPIEKINKRILTTFLNELSKELGANSINNFRAYLGSMFGKLVDDDILVSNPVSAIAK
ncbi:site-specific integrase [Zhouia amylolytica]|nr:site-specific integrase [Zhouia amylolytica]MCQ0112477.1 phage integrase SAM-like domain-containing protein [Zhouia amylolytica]